MDFYALRAYLGGKWFIYEARMNMPHIGWIKIACGP